MNIYDVKLVIKAIHIGHKLIDDSDSMGIWQLNQSCKQIPPLAEANFNDFLLV